MIVYLVTNRANGKRYVGKTQNSMKQRWRNHLADVRRGKNWALHNAIRKYGPGSFEHDVLAIGLTPSEGSECEKFYILLLGTRSHALGYNMTDGGDGVSGWKKSPEAIERSRSGHRGSKRSAETRALIGERSRGRVPSPETRKKIASSMRHRIALGKHFSPEHRARIRASLQKKLSSGWRPIPAKDSTQRPANGASPSPICPGNTTTDEGDVQAHARSEQ